jgi:hypothetical protein
MALSLIQTSLFDSFGDLPLHPLAVHGAAVLIPLSAFALLALAFVPKWRATYFPLTLVGLALSTGVAFVAKESREALAQKVGYPEQHAALAWRTQKSEDKRDYNWFDALFSWFIARPAILIVALVTFVLGPFSFLLWLGPPDHWFN